MAEYSSKREERKDEITQREDILVGRNAVSEALRSGRTIDKVFAASGDTDHGLRRLCSQAKQAGAVISMTDRRKLDQMAAGGAHQGIIAYAAAHTYATVDEILQRAADQGRTPLLVICDEIVDPHNLGAILRTAECAGACGVIIPKRRSVGLTAVVAKTSAGAIEYLPVARVTNIAATVDKLEAAGRLGLRHGGRRRDGPLRRRPHRTDGHCHRQRGPRHQPPGGRAVRLSAQHPHAGADFLAQRLRRGGDLTL